VHDDSAAAFDHGRNELPVEANDAEEVQGEILCPRVIGSLQGRRVGVHRRGVLDHDVDRPKDSAAAANAVIPSGVLRSAGM
jgi:hypothetical protein